MTKEKKDLVRRALNPDDTLLPNLPKGELFIYESFTDNFVPKELVWVEKIVRISSLLDLDIIPIPYEISISLSEKYIKPLSSFFSIVTIPGVFSSWIKHLGFFNALKAISRDHEKLRELSKTHTQGILKNFSMIKERGFDAIAIVDDIAGSSGLLFSKHVFRTLYKPFMEIVVQEAKLKGLYVFFHSDGYLEEVLPEIVGLGVDCLCTFDTLAQMDVYKLKNGLNMNVSFMGTIDLLAWDEKRIEFEIRRAEREFSKGGLILGSSCGLSKEIPFERLVLLYPKAVIPKSEKD